MKRYDIVSEYNHSVCEDRIIEFVKIKKKGKTVSGLNMKMLRLSLK